MQVKWSYEDGTRETNNIFPASRWEPYDPEKKWDKYTVSGTNCGLLFIHSYWWLSLVIGWLLLVIFEVIVGYGWLSLVVG